MNGVKALVETLKTANRNERNYDSPAEIVYGIVQKTEPLQILINSIVFPKIKFIIPEYMTEKIIKLDLSHNHRIDVSNVNDIEDITDVAIDKKYSSKSLSKEIEIKIREGLKVGDNIVCIKNKGADKFLIIDRIVL